MKKRIVSLNAKEKLINEFVTKKQRITITDKRLIIEDPKESISIKTEDIGTVQIMRKSSSFAFLRVLSKAGANLFAQHEHGKVKIYLFDLTAFESALYESILSDVIVEDEEEK